MTTTMMPTMNRIANRLLGGPLTSRQVHAMPNETNETNRKMLTAVTSILQTILGILITISTALVTWCLVQIVSLKVDMAEEKAARKGAEAAAFTAQDGKEVWKEISDIRQHLAALEAKKGS